MYIPKNRVITNLHTSGNELAYKDTLQPYKGTYWKTFEGKYYTGKNPNETPYKELVKIENVEDTFDDLKPQSQFAVVDAPTPFENLDDGPYQESMLIRYAQLTKLDLSKANRKSLPYPTFPEPTIDDYELGSYTRYFIVKVNEISYMELSKDIFDKIEGQDKGWEWELYTTFTIPWTLTGNKAEVEQTNKNIVALQEQRLKRRGFASYLKFDYLKFYLSDLES